MSANSIWSGVLVYTNIKFYSELEVSSRNVYLFMAMTMELLYGYFVLFEVVLLVLIVLLFAVMLLCGRPRKGPVPMRTV